MTTRRASGSRRRLNAVESATSQNTTVTVFRTSCRPPVTCAAPHDGQKCASRGRTAWHAGQRMRCSLSLRGSLGQLLEEDAADDFSPMCLHIGGGVGEALTYLDEDADFLLAEVREYLLLLRWQQGHTKACSLEPLQLVIHARFPSCVRRDGCRRCGV